MRFFLVLRAALAETFARHSRERGSPVPFVREHLKSLDSRVHGNDGQKLTRAGSSPVADVSRVS
ncbi:MAG: hypothetical protein ACREP7_15555 [Lysobacter sp.]